MDIGEIRRLNMLVLTKRYKSQADFAEAVGKPASYISQIKRGKTSSGKDVSMGNDVARDIEKALSLPHGWMDKLQIPGVDLSLDKALANEKVVKLIESLRNTSNVIVDYDDENEDDDFFVIDVHDVIFCCGDGNNADFGFESVKGKRKFPVSFFKEKGVKPENFKLLCASNDSQAPYINDGDIVGIDISDIEIRDGEMYAILLDGERMFKRIFRQGGGVFRLHCYNSEYPDKIIDHTNGKSLKIVGRQVYRAG